MFESRHSRKEHKAKEYIDGCPETSCVHVEIWVFYPSQSLAQFDGCHGNNGLPDNKEYIQITFKELAVSVVGGMNKRLVLLGR